MAKRMGTSWRASTESVQGEGSWIELRGLTVGEVKAARRGELEDDALILGHLLSWNWVDEEGKALPPPPTKKKVTPAVKKPTGAKVSG